MFVILGIELLVILLSLVFIERRWWKIEDSGFSEREVRKWRYWCKLFLRL